MLPITFAPSLKVHHHCWISAAKHEILEGKYLSLLPLSSIFYEFHGKTSEFNTCNYFFCEGSLIRNNRDASTPNLHRSRGIRPRLLHLQVKTQSPPNLGSDFSC